MNRQHFLFLIFFELFVSVLLHPDPRVKGMHQSCKPKLKKMEVCILT